MENLKNISSNNLEQSIIDWAGESPKNGFDRSKKFIPWGKNNKFRATFSDCGNYATAFNHATKEKQTFYLNGFDFKKIKIPKTPETKNINQEFNSLSKKPILNHPYLIKKNISIQGLNIRWHAEKIVIPVFSTENIIISWQTISITGEKKFKDDHPLGKGYHFSIGNPESEKIYICEGVATGATIYSITNMRTYCAFAKSNLDNVVRDCLKKYPKKKIALCLDNDGLNTHETLIKDERLYIKIPETDGDFNDHQKIEQERIKLTTFEDKKDDQKIKKIPYEPGDDIETDIKNRLKALETEIRFNIRDQIEEFKTGDDTWKIFDDGTDAKLYSDCHRKLKPWPDGKLKKISHADWQKHTKALVHRQEVDPFKLWIENLPKWDNKDRLESVLPFLFKINGSENLSKWAFKAVLLTAIIRTFKPGYKFDMMIVLQGPQGIGKSSLWSCLFEKESWFSDNIHFSGRDKEIIETTSGTVLVENAELAGARRAELEKIKALITRQSDKVRFAYARKVSVLPRQFVIVGTTNEPCSLPNDQTGNRRFVPIALDKKEDTAWNNGKKVRDYITTNRKQLWAETLHLFKVKKESPLIPQTLQPTAQAEAEKHRSKNELLEEAVLEKINETHGQPIKIKKIADYLMEKDIIPKGGAHPGIQREIAGILRKQGWDRKKDKKNRLWSPVAHGGASTDPGGV